MAAPYLEQAGGAMRAVLGVGIGAFVVGELTQTLRRRRECGRVDIMAEAAFRVAFLAGVLMLPLGRAIVPGAVIGGGAWVFAAGAVVGWCGLLLRWWSFATLGRYFTLVVKASGDQPVVDRGPYRYLRHPSYAGLMLAVAGCSVMLGNWVGAVASVVLVAAALVFRIGREERMLVAALGEPYRAFASTRARLVPFVW